MNTTTAIVLMWLGLALMWTGGFFGGVLACRQGWSICEVQGG